MRVAFLILTTRCNRGCSYCFYETGYQERLDPSRVLPVDDALLESLKGTGVGSVILSGGEPLVLPRVEETIALAAGKDLFTLLLSNGDLLTRERFDRIEAAGLSALSLSLDSLKEGKEAKAPWEILDKAAASTTINTAVITPVTRRNLDHLTEIIRRVSDLGLFVLLQPVFIPHGHPLFSDLSLSASSPEEHRIFNEAVNLWESIYGARPYGELLRAFYETHGNASPSECLMGTDTVVIDSNGDVLPCFHRPDLCTGNLLDEDPAKVVERSFEKGKILRSASCFGEHCISLFSHI